MSTDNAGEQMGLRYAATRLNLLEDYLAQWGTPVDYSDIGSFDNASGGQGGLGAYAGPVRL